MWAGWAWGGGSDQNCFRDAAFFAFFCVSGGLFPPASLLCPPLGAVFSLFSTNCRGCRGQFELGVAWERRMVQLVQTPPGRTPELRGKDPNTGWGRIQFREGEGRSLHAAKGGAGGMPTLGYRVCRGFCGAKRLRAVAWRSNGRPGWVLANERGAGAGGPGCWRTRGQRCLAADAVASAVDAARAKPDTPDWS